MGYSTIVSISNDAWGSIEKHPKDFIAGIRDKGIFGAYSGKRSSVFGETFPVGNHANYVSAHPSQHADVPQLALTHRGMFTRIGYSSVTADMSDRDLDLLEGELKTARKQIALAAEQLKLEKQRRAADK